MEDGRRDHSCSLADPMGRALLDHLEGIAGQLVYRDGPAVQDGTVEQFYFRPPEEWAEETVADLERLAEAGTVLDVGCGAGQHLHWLQERAPEAVGVDVSPRAVATARQRGVRQVIVGDMHELPFEEGRFEALHCVGTQLGLGGSVAGITALLREFARVGTDDSVAIVDSYDPRRLDEDFFGYRPDPRDGVAHRCFHLEYEREAWPAGRRAVGRTLHFLCCSPSRLEEIVTETPWQVRSVRHTEPREIHYRTLLDRRPTGRPNA